MDLIFTVYSFVVLVFSVVFHEVAHGWAAYKLGDPSAKYSNRLSFNPINHLDPVGSVIFPLMTILLTQGRGPIFGWAKPVPINPNNFRDQRWGELKSALAGPMANILLALVSGFLLRFLYYSQTFFLLLAPIAITNLALAFFNLLPIPPLDGSHVLKGLLGSRGYELEMLLSRYGLVFLLLFFFFAPNIISPVVFFFFSLLTGIRF